jgi:hypothetical protein
MLLDTKRLFDDARRHGLDAGSDLSSYVDVTSRDAYLAWVVSWKAALADLVAGSRAARKTMKDPAADFHARCSAQSTRMALKRKTTLMIALRRQGKVLSAAAAAAARTAREPEPA